MTEITYQERFRKAVIKYKQNHTIAETANFFEIGEDTVSRWDSQYKKEGTLSPRKRNAATYYHIVSEEGKNFLTSEIEKRNDITLEELRQKYLARFNQDISVPTVHYHLAKLNITHKKSFYDPNKLKEEVQEKRKIFVKNIINIPKKDRNFLDETGTCMNMTQQYARSLKNTKACGEKPTAQGKHYTTVSIISEDGMNFEHTFQGYLNKAYFIHLLKVFIIPKFKNTTKYLIMDNCSSHKNPDVIKILEENNVNYLFLPPYSPEYNPIELAWSKVKSFVKKCKPRCELNLWLSIKSAINAISKKDIDGYFNHVNKYYLNLI
jgi:transposase